jgi:endonuclease/exonuclease/phosphatase family metal-dependent hydrolase
MALALIARKPRPAADQQGQIINDQQSPITERPTLTIATYNIQTGKSLAGKRNIKHSAAVISEADIVGVQEVYAPKLLNKIGFGRSQSQVLAVVGRFGWLFCATRRRWMREHRGNLLLSKLPVSSWQIEMLPDQSGRSFRNMTIAKFYWQDEEIHFINTHLHTRQGREEQLDIVLREFAKYPRAILVGDFNTRSDNPLLSRALHNVEITDAVSVAELEPNNPDRIDWILTKGFSVNSGEMVEKGVSDHPYYSVNLSIKDSANRKRLR